MSDVDEFLSADITSVSSSWLIVLTCESLKLSKEISTGSALSSITTLIVFSTGLPSTSPSVTIADTFNKSGFSAVEK